MIIYTYDTGSTSCCVIHTVDLFCNFLRYNISLILLTIYALFYYIYIYVILYRVFDSLKYNIHAQVEWIKLNVEAIL